MTNAWIYVTLAAVLFQTGRFMLQKQLSSTGLSPSGATFARFLWAAPLVTLALLVSGIHWPELPARFWIMAICGGITQILATVCVVALFGSRNFAVGITLKKTEVLLTALMGIVVLGEAVSAPALAAICVGLIGVLVLTDMPDPRGGWRRFGNRAAVLGVASGLFFALSGVTYRGASLAVPGAPWDRALVTLFVVVWSQVILMGLWLRLRNRGEITRVARSWRLTGLVGITSVLGSYCWFTAFTLQNAAYVYAVGQSEVVLSLLASLLFFHERITRREVGGIGLVTLSVLGLILLA